MNINLEKGSCSKTELEDREIILVYGSDMRNLKKDY